jgi:Holliday junction resolvasome RuvABC DNA-binding subunit
MDQGSFVPRQPLLNLICAPEILFTKDSQLLKNIDKIWETLAKKLVEESKGKVDLSKKSIINSFYGYWNLSEESKQKLEKREREELSKLGVN